MIYRQTSNGSIPTRLAQDVSTCVRHALDAQQLRALQDLAHPRAADGQRGGVGELQQRGQSVGRHTVQLADAAAVAHALAVLLALLRPEQTPEVQADRGHDGAVRWVASAAGRQREVTKQPGPTLSIETGQQLVAVLREGDPDKTILSWRHRHLQAERSSCQLTFPYIVLSTIQIVTYFSYVTLISSTGIFN